MIYKILFKLNYKTRNYLNLKIFNPISRFLLCLYFLPPEFRINYCNFTSLYEIDDLKVEKYKLGKNKGDIALILLHSFSSKYRNKIYLMKLSYCIAYRNYSHIKASQLISLFEKYHFKANELKILYSYIPAGFVSYGDLDNYEKLQLYLKKRLDYKLNRSIGIYKNPS